MAMKPRAMMKKMKDGGGATKKATLSDFNKMIKTLGLSKSDVAEMLGLPTRDASGVKRNMMRGGTPKKPMMRGDAMMAKKKMMRGGMSKKKK